MKILTGNILAGFAVSDHKFQGVSTLNQSHAYGLLRPAPLTGQPSRCRPMSWRLMRCTP